jgi:hypothetical protein
VNTRVCDSCGVERECDSANSNLISDGLTLPFRALGYYGGFIDDWPFDPMKDEELLNICASCVTALLNALPGLKARLAEMYPHEINVQSAAREEKSSF